jgi:hypothetical protein
MKEVNIILNKSFILTNDITLKQNEIKGIMFELNNEQNKMNNIINESVLKQILLLEKQEELNKKQDIFTKNSEKKIKYFVKITNSIFKNIINSIKFQKNLFEIQKRFKKNFKKFEKNQNNNFLFSKKILKEILNFSDEQKLKLIEHNELFKNTTNKFYEIVNQILMGHDYLISEVLNFEYFFYYFVCFFFAYFLTSIDQTKG